MAIFVFWQLLTAANRYLQLSKHFLHFPHTCFISSSMRNVMFLPLKLAELLQFQYFWQLLAAYNSCQQLSKWFHLQLILTSFMQNFEFLAFKMTELWLFMYFWHQVFLCTLYINIKKTYEYEIKFRRNFFNIYFKDELPAG
jgi:hypothetical protein